MWACHRVLQNKSDVIILRFAKNNQFPPHEDEFTQHDTEKKR